MTKKVKIIHMHGKHEALSIYFSEIGKLYKSSSNSIKKVQPYFSPYGFKSTNYLFYFEYKEERSIEILKSCVGTRHKKLQVYDKISKLYIRITKYYFCNSNILLIINHMWVCMYIQKKKHYSWLIKPIETSRINNISFQRK